MKPYKEDFKKALTGFIGDSKKFKTKLLEENTANEEQLLSEDILKTRYQEIFSTEPTKEEYIKPISFEELLNCETNEILSKKIIGKEDINIAALIKKLDNSSWVQEGMKYYNKSDGVCPFCQQKVNNDFSKSISEYFDTTFTQQIEMLNNLYNDYKEKKYCVYSQLLQIQQNANRHLKDSELETNINLFNEITENNIHIIEDKLKNPSLPINLKNLSDTISKIKNIINQANNEISEYNKLVDNLADSREILKKQIWKFLITKTQNDIQTYLEKEKNLNQAISSLGDKIKENKTVLSKKVEELHELEKKITSVQPTCNAINSILKSYGFTNFSLKVVDKSSYILVRPDGLEVNDTLSEGEKSFVTFLYFYNLIQGSLTSSGMKGKRVVVFDDPISSLDNEVLFIVSSLIRDIAIDRDRMYKNIVQLFVLTHNVYFHKEVSYEKYQINSKEHKPRLTRKAFWVVKKKENKSYIIPYLTDNPIKTSYQILWESLKDEKPNPISLPNNMRRILENYFKTLGGISIDELENRFDSEDKVICRALCSWINDGSHTCFGEEYYSSLDDNQIEKYKKVFQQIFEKQGHIAHYNMMMGINDNIEADEKKIRS